VYLLIMHGETFVAVTTRLLGIHHGFVGCWVPYIRYRYVCAEIYKYMHKQSVKPQAATW
jgi:hypothetical protein